jgi:SEC-C motif-containing protein
MRSRYTAYVRGAVDYLIETATAPEKRQDIERWSRESRWTGLEVIATERGGPDDDEGTVEFIARAEGFAHHERSFFRRIDGRWRYVSGETPRPRPARKEATPGRNDPCPCGSGKKYKKCHGA